MRVKINFKGRKNLYKISLVLVLLLGVAACNYETELTKAEEQLPKNEKHLDKEEWVADIFSRLTLKDKIRITHASGIFTSGGVPRLGINDLIMSDGPHGIRGRIDNNDWSKRVDSIYTATNFTSGVALAATWNTQLAEQFGKALGKESKLLGKEVQLGPALNIIRTPLGGRNFEYYSEDPHLICQLAVPVIVGMQSQGIAACAKHFVANNQELHRFTVNVDLSERALREIYLPGFKAAVTEAGVKTVMAAYNKVRGESCTQNSYLLKDILKGEWDFDGVVISDWDATNSTRGAYKAGLDIEMGTFSPWFNHLPYDQDYASEYFHFGNQLLVAIENNSLEIKPLNDKVKRILGLMYDIRQGYKSDKEPQIDTSAHYVLARNIGQEAIVLLKNEYDILPIKNETVKSIAVIGEMAVVRHGNSGGSSEVTSPYEITPLEGIQEAAKKAGIEIKYAPGDYFQSHHQSKEIFRKEAKEIAATSDLVIFVSGLSHDFETEGSDRSSFLLPLGQEALLKTILTINTKVVVVLTGSSAVDMNSWVEEVPAIMQMWYLHQEGGNALADVLFGEVSPSGKLPVTFPKVLTDGPAHANEPRTYPGSEGTVYYDEGILVGYRYYDAKKIEPLFPFGHGLSYTDFDYKELDIKMNDDTLYVTVQLQNIGKREGKEVVQLYIAKKSSEVLRAPKELKKFKKVHLAVNESERIMLKVPITDLAYYSEEDKSWIVEKGKYEINIGASSRDIRLVGEVEIL